MTTIQVEYTGNLKCRALHEESGTVLLTDAPKDNQGDGSSFSPTDLVATALGTCICTIMGIVAKRRNLDIAGTTVQVVKEMATAPHRRIGKLLTTIRFNQNFEGQDRTMLEHGAHTCPVHKSLHPEIEAPITFVYPAS
jgi:putative redox protein